MSCGVGRRHGSDLALLWLWCGPAARAPIQPLAWELPYAPRAAQERGKNTKNLLLLLRCHGALLVPSLTWELLCALGVAQNKQKTNKQKTGAEDLNRHFPKKTENGQQAYDKRLNHTNGTTNQNHNNVSTSSLREWLL